MTVPAAVALVPEADVQQWLVDFWEAIGKTCGELKKRDTEARTSSEITVQLDGTLYEILYQSAETRLRLDMQDVEASANIDGHMAIIRWANSVRLAIENRIRR